MKTVTSFEGTLLRLLCGFFQPERSEQLLPLLNKSTKEPTRLTPAAVELVQDALSKGSVLWLARAGAWRSESFLRQGRACTGMLWQRTPPADLGLTFSSQTLRFLIWLTGNRPASAANIDWAVPGAVFTPGDQWLLFLAYETLRGVSLHTHMHNQRGFRQNMLCRLFYPEEVGIHAQADLDFEPWVIGAGSYILEALQDHVARRLVALEMSKHQVTSFPVMTQWGQAQASVLMPLIQACEQTGRQDLARFVLAGLHQILTSERLLADWLSQLVPEPGMKMADRTQVYRHALLLPHAMIELGRWQAQARTVGYFDEGYHASQAWKQLWEQYSGDTLLERARALLRQADLLPNQRGV